MSATTRNEPQERSLQFAVGKSALVGDLTMPEEALGIVLFAHGSGSGRQSPRNRLVARALQQAGLGTLLFDLLTPQEEAAERHTAHFRFDIDLLTQRLVGVTDSLEGMGIGRQYPVAYFGASTGAAAALRAA